MTDFLGTFDGDNHTISGLCIKVSNARAALFNQIAATGTVKNLRVTNSYFEAKQDASNWNSAATIAGRLNGGLVENCYSDAIIKCTTAVTTDEQVGGIIGMTNADGSRIFNCVFAGEASGPNCHDVGGILGKNNSGKTVQLSNCLNLGSVKGKNAGGIIGADRSNKASTITNCINLSKNIVQVTNSGEEVKNSICGYLKGGVTINTYLITDFGEVMTTAAADAVVEPTAPQKTLAEFLALTIEGWNFKDGCVPCPIAGLEIALADYLTEWGITLS